MAETNASTDNKRVVFNSYKEESRKNWGVNLKEGDKLTRDQVETGALLRIADSLEKMEQPYRELIDEVNRLRRIYTDTYKSNKRLMRSKQALKSVITRQKKQISELKNQD